MRALAALLALLLAACSEPPATEPGLDDLVLDEPASPVDNASIGPPVLVAVDGAWAIDLPAGTVGQIRVEAAAPWTPRVDTVNGTGGWWTVPDPAAGPECGSLAGVAWSSEEGAPPALDAGTYDVRLWHLGEEAALVIGAGEAAGGGSSGASTNVTPAASGWRAAPLPVQHGPSGPRAAVDWSFRADLPAAGAVVLAGLRHGTDVGPRSADLSVSQGKACAQVSAASGPQGAAFVVLHAATSPGPATWSGHYSAVALASGDVQVSGTVLVPP